jgi:branched-chain amino acid transport system ATP-binding protein
MEEGTRGRPVEYGSIIVDESNQLDDHGALTREAILEIDGLSVSYGAISAVRDVSLRVDRGTCTAVIGSNGAGKSTLVSVILNLKKAKSGRIDFDGKDITAWRTEKIVRAGLRLVPEGRGLLPSLSVEENLLIGAYVIPKGRTERLESVYEVLPVLAPLRRRSAHLLSGGELQLLAIGRALMGSPKLLILDEPSMGLAPKVVGTVLECLKRLRERGTSILLIEQNAALAFDLADNVYVLELGKIALEGPPEKLLADSRLRATYLGLE